MLTTANQATFARTATHTKTKGGVTRQHLCVHVDIGEGGKVKPVNLRFNVGVFKHDRNLDAYVDVRGRWQGESENKGDQIT